MRTIVATDIHGVTTEIRSLIAPIASEAIYVSPWDTEACPFANEPEAVAAFICQHGFASYAAKIAAAGGQDPAYIIGFSVGATAAWLYSASGICNPQSKASLFYGSRIRDYCSLLPKCNITAIFAEIEPSFSPQQFIGNIASEQVCALVEPGTSHGFMNPRSANFAPKQCSAHLSKLAVELAQFRFSGLHRQLQTVTSKKIKISILKPA